MKTLKEDSLREIDKKEEEVSALKLQTEKIIKEKEEYLSSTVCILHFT
jgi:hypothetical protein